MHFLLIKQTLEIEWLKSNTLVNVIRVKFKHLNFLMNNLYKTQQKKLEESESELRTRLISLQTGLENGEAVQKDFVRLAQSLQKELERLRGQNNVVSHLDHAFYLY